MGEGANTDGLSRIHIIKSVEQSLKRLQTDYIDLYQGHCFDYGTPLEETLYAFDSLVRAGKVRYIGLSNFKGYQLQKAVDLAAQLGCSPIVSLQPLYNMLDRSLEWEIVELCQREGIGIIPWSPLRGGWLSGKIKRGMETAPSGTRIAVAEEQQRMENWNAYNTERTWKVLDALHEVAEQRNVSCAQVALNWLLRRPAVVAPIIGARNTTQIMDNLATVNWQLSDHEYTMLTEASALAGPYPYDFIGNYGRIRKENPFL